MAEIKNLKNNYEEKKACLEDTIKKIKEEISREGLPSKMGASYFKNINALCFFHNEIIGKKSGWEIKLENKDGFFIYYLCDECYQKIT